MIEPRLMVGGDAVLAIATDRPTLWLVDVADAVTRDRAEAVAVLPHELARHAARADAGERLIRDRLARLMLASAGRRSPDEVVVDRSPAGAPIVTAPAGWHLSVAARWPGCVIGVARERLGVDIERVERPLPPVLDVLTASERDRLSRLPASDQAHAFARMWAAKESHAKWLGEPRRVDPARVETTDDRVRSAGGTTRCWVHDADELIVAACTGDG